MTAPFLADLDRHTGDWLEFALLAASVAVAQFFVVRTPGNKSYHTTGVFLIAAALLVEPALVALIPLIQHSRVAAQPPDVVRPVLQHPRHHDRDDVGVGGSARRPQRRRPDRQRRHPVRPRGTVASIVLVVLNSALIAPMIRWVNGHPMRQLFSYQTLSTEFVFAALGVVLAAFWIGNPWLRSFAIAPAADLGRFSVPQLRPRRVDRDRPLPGARLLRVGAVRGARTGPAAPSGPCR